MKALVVSHSYVVDINQQKIQRLAELPGISVALAVPLKWRDMGRDIPLHLPDDPAFRLYPIKVFWHDHLYAYFLDWAQLLKVFFKERPDIVYIEEEPQSFSAFQAILLSKIFRAKIVLLTWENLRVKFSLYKRLLAWWNIRNLDAVVGGTGEALKTIRELGFKKRGWVNPQFGLDEDAFRPKDAGPLRAKLGLGNGFVIGFIARLTREKGVLTLIRAAAQMPFDFTLLVVGDGPVKEQAVQLAAELGIENKVKWGGIISHNQLPEYMNCFDLFVLPFHTHF
jgi:glycosyltransferase involved in cell wall biosynthesis